MRHDLYIIKANQSNHMPQITMLSKTGILIDKIKWRWFKLQQANEMKALLTVIWYKTH